MSPDPPAHDPDPTTDDERRKAEDLLGDLLPGSFSFYGRQKELYLPKTLRGSARLCTTGILAQARAPAVR